MIQSIAKGNNIVFSWTWYEKKKKLIEITNNDNLNLSFSGFLITQNTAGKLAIKVKTIVILTKVCYSNFDVYFIIGSVIHQNEATFN